MVAGEAALVLVQHTLAVHPATLVSVKVLKDGSVRLRHLQKVRIAA